MAEFVITFGLAGITCEFHEENTPRRVRPNPNIVMLAQRWHGQNPAGWLIAEKLNGLRAKWTGRRLLSRNGNEFAAPAWFTDALPDSDLDGELWMGRGRYEQTRVAVQRLEPVTAEWRRIKFMVFDAPGTDSGFTDRLAAAEAALLGSPVARVLDHPVCRGRDHFDAAFTRVLKARGEGLMLRQPDSRYDVCRSHDLLKCKPHDSAETKVVGRMTLESGVTALTCQWRDAVFQLDPGQHLAKRRAW